MCVLKWLETVDSHCLPGVDKRLGATGPVSLSLRDIITIAGTAEQCRKAGAQQMWGLVRDFICHCTLQQTSLLIRSPWIRRGIWTFCSWADWMVSFRALVANEHQHAHTPLHLLKLHYIKISWRYPCHSGLLELSLHLVAALTLMRETRRLCVAHTAPAAWL